MNWLKKSILLVFVFSNIFGYAISTNDSLLFIYNHAKEDSSKIIALQTLAKNNLSTPDTAIKYAEIAIDLANKNKNILLAAKSLNQIAVAYYYKGDLIKSKSYLNLSLGNYLKVNNKKGIANCYNGIGVIYYDQGKLYKALQLFIRSLRINTKLNEKKNVAMTLNNIGNVYKDLNNFDESLEYYNRSIKIKKEINDKHGLAMSLNNIGLLYHNNKKYLKALDYYNKSLNIKKQIKDVYGEAMTLNNIGLTFEIQKNYDSALDYYQKSIKLKKQIGDQLGLAMTLINIATIQRDRKNFNACFDNLKKAEIIAKDIGATTQLRDCYQTFYETYEKINNAKEALKYYKLYNIAKDSMMSEESFKNIQKLQAQYQAERKQLIIENLYKKEELSKVKIARNEALIKSSNVTNLSLIIGLIISLGLMIFFFFNNKNRKKRNYHLRKILEEKDVLFKEVHHRVKNNFQVISSLLNLHANNTDNVAVQNALNIAKERVGAMALVHEKLYLSNDLTKIDMKDYIEQLMSHLIHTIDDSIEITSKINIDNIFLDIDKAIPIGLIFNEWITNSIKYAFNRKSTNNVISISIHQKDDEILISYQDNGKGLPQNFNLDELDSLGLNLVQILVIQLHGKLHVENVNGTKFSFSIKLDT